MSECLCRRFMLFSGEPFHERAGHVAALVTRDLVRVAPLGFSRFPRIHGGASVCREARTVPGSG